MPLVLLDSEPLSLITNPGRKTETADCKRWLKTLVQGNVLVVVPEIVDFELRRVLLQSKKLKGIERLDKLGDIGLVYAPITTEVARKAAELWAWARNTGQQTAHDQSIDIDVFLAAHAIILSEQFGEYAVVATSNVRHIARYTPARTWKDITLAHCFNPNIPTASSVPQAAAVTNQHS